MSLEQPQECAASPWVILMHVVSRVGTGEGLEGLEVHERGAQMKWRPVRGPSASPLPPRFNQCYGVLGVLDHLHGTDTVFKQTKAYERHILLLGFTPLSESIPDPPKKME